jgi:hypothetical protein
MMTRYYHFDMIAPTPVSPQAVRATQTWFRHYLEIAALIELQAMPLSQWLARKSIWKRQQITRGPWWIDSWGHSFWRNDWWCWLTGWSWWVSI